MSSDDRKLSLGGSDMAAVMGVSKYRSPLQVFLEKTGLVPGNEGNRFTYWGTRLEDIVAEEFAKETGKKVVRHNKILRHPRFNFITGNIDRRIVGEPAVLECKTASAYKHEAWDGAAPIDYIIQLQHYLMLTGAEVGYFAVLIGGNDFRHFEMKRDDALIRDIEVAAERFWMDHIVTAIPPEANELDNDILMGMYPTADETMLELPDNYETACKIYLEAHQQESEAKERKEAIKAKLKALIGSNSGAENETYKVKWSRFEKAAVDLPALRAAHPDIVAQFVRKTPSGTIRISEIKRK